MTKLVGAWLLLTTLHAQCSEYPTPLVREEQKIVIAGVTETWQLKWASAPKPLCEPNDTSLTCPCAGFAFGEGGDLILVRTRGQIEVDRLPLTPFFEQDFIETGRLAMVQRWLPDYKKDFQAYQKSDFTALVAKRPIVQVMHLADYDHDGQKSEFYLQASTAPCGKSIGIVVGVSIKNPRLHVFGTASEATKPLYLQKHEWEALRQTSGPTTVRDWDCGDHGADTQTELKLHWTLDGIEGSRREFTCPPNPKRLISETPL